MQLLVRAFPVLPGREQQFKEFAGALHSARAAEAAEFFLRMGVTRETWHLQETPHGTWAIAVTQFAERPIEVAARDYAASQASFDRWFKDQVMLVSGINPDHTPLGPPTHCLFDSQNLIADFSTPQ